MKMSVKTGCSAAAQRVRGRAQAISAEGAWRVRSCASHTNKHLKPPRLVFFRLFTLRHAFLQRHSTSACLEKLCEAEEIILHLTYFTHF